MMFKILKFSSKIYQPIQKYCLPFLPQDPLSIKNTPSSFLTKSLIKMKINSQIKDFDPIIQEELLFFIRNQKQLDCLQSITDIGNILRLIKRTEGLEGEILELGIAKGGTTIMMAHFLKKIGSKRKIYGCDTFEGLPYEDKFSDKTSEKVSGMFKYSYDAVSKQLKKFEVDDKIILIKGLFEDTLHSQLSHLKFSFVFNDSDLYDATKFSLEFVYPRLLKKGIMIFDQYGGGALNRKKGDWGESKAVDEFCAAKKIQLHFDPEPMLVK